MFFSGLANGLEEQMSEFSFIYLILFVPLFKKKKKKEARCSQWPDAISGHPVPCELGADREPTNPERKPHLDNLSHHGCTCTVVLQNTHILVSSVY